MSPESAQLVAVDSIMAEKRIWAGNDIITDRKPTHGKREEETKNRGSPAPARTDLK